MEINIQTYIVRCAARVEELMFRLCTLIEVLSFERLLERICMRDARSHRRVSCRELASTLLKVTVSLLFTVFNFVRSAYVEIEGRGAGQATTTSGSPDD